MGSCCSVSLRLDQILNNCFESFRLRLNYLHRLEENIRGLHDARDELKGKYSDMLEKIEAEERLGRRKRLHEVQLWLTKAEALETQVNAQLEDSSNQIPRLCVCGLCSKNLMSSYRYAKKVSVMLKYVDDQISKSNFDVLTSEVPPPKVDMRPLGPTVDQKDLLDNTWKLFTRDEIGILGIYGMGGVGKTTLLKQVNNKINDDNFDVVIWITVSKNSKEEKIQEEIGKKLGFDEGWKHQETCEKALDIYNKLITKKFVLFLDDIWEYVDLTKIGVPSPKTQHRCKVVFTTRSEEVCRQMSVDKKLKVECLGDKEAWDLFRKVVTDDTLQSHPGIPKLAESVASKCKGLPLALEVIGKAMACKTTLTEWEHAVHALTLSDIEFSGMQDKVLPILKFSYDNLKDEQIKKCFQYCALFPEDCMIKNELLVDYWISEGLIDKTECIKKAEDEGHIIIATLVRASLVIKKKHHNQVKMHDVVREMALWVASDMGNQKGNFVVHARAHLLEVPNIIEWEYAKRVSLMENKIEVISGCPKCHQLETLLLQNNECQKISDGFFHWMPRLCVLDISSNRFFNELPEGISELVCLRYLNLSFTSIKKLPDGLWKLEELIHLNLEYTNKLKSITGVSRLSKLKILKLKDSQALSDDQVLKEVKLIKSLEIFTVSLDMSPLLEEFLNDPKLVRCTRNLIIRSCSVKSSSLMLLLTNIDSLTHFTIWELDVSEMIIDWGKRVRGKYFSNLCHVSLAKCKGITDMTWLISASNLQVLSVCHNRGVKEIIREEENDGMMDETRMNHNIPFQHLKILHLVDLPDLESIYWTPLLFPSLSDLNICGCPRLRKLPLHSKSLPAADDQLLHIVMDDKGWVKRLEWEDEATRQRFLHLFLASSDYF